MASPGLFDLTGKVAVVTGGTRGIGMMMTRGLLDAGARVWITSRKADACEQAAAELSSYGEVRALAADLSQPEECDRLVAAVTAEEPALHVLVNNAGATWGEPLETFPLHAWDKVMNINLRTPFLLTRGFLPLLEKAATADDPARVINVGSIDGLHVNALPHYPYSASKAGVHHLTRVFARELGPKQITVNAVAPGPFESKMMALHPGDDGRPRGRGVAARTNRATRRHGRGCGLPVQQSRRLCDRRRHPRRRRHRHHGLAGRRQGVRTGRRGLRPRCGRYSSSRCR